MRINGCTWAGSVNKGSPSTINIRILTHWRHLWDVNTSFIMIIEHIRMTQRSGEVDGMCALVGDIIWGVSKVLTAFFTLQTSSKSWLEGYIHISSSIKCPQVMASRWGGSTKCGGIFGYFDLIQWSCWPGDLTECHMQCPNGLWTTSKWF